MNEPRQPPYSIEAEQSVLGGVLLVNEAWHEVAEIITSEDFYRLDHQLICQAMAEMIGASKACDFVTLSNHMAESGSLQDAGGLAYLAAICNNTPSAVNVKAYAEIVAERATLRRIIGAASDIATLGYRPDGRPLEQVVAEVQQITAQIESRAERKGGLVSVGSTDEAYFAELYRRAETGYSGMSTGLANVDSLIVGLEPGDLMLIAGRPSMGKTVLGLNIAENVAKNGNPGDVLFFSLEMSLAQLKSRQYARMASVPLGRIRDPKTLDQLDHDALTAARARVRAMTLLVDDTAGISIQLLRSRCMRRSRRRKIKLVGVDYVQLVTGGSGQNRTNQVDDVSRQLKALGKELGCPVIALAQLSRGVESRDDKRPRMSDLREAGGLEQDADIIILMYRDEYYNRATPHKGVVEMDVIKIRNGETGRAEGRFSGQFCDISDWHGPDAKARMEAIVPAKSRTPTMRVPKQFHSDDND